MIAYLSVAVFDGDYSVGVVFIQPCAMPGSYSCSYQYSQRQKLALRFLQGRGVQSNIDACISDYRFMYVRYLILFWWK